jgi:glycosyltransferase involved in cell wall biosynthesis
MKEIRKVALVLGYDSAVDRDAVGVYTEQLHKHMVLALEEAPKPDLDIDLVPFRPHSATEWLKGFSDTLENYDLVHVEYPFEGWGTSVGPGVCPGFLKLFARYGRAKLVTTFHEWHLMHPLRKTSVLPLALSSDGVLFVSNREHATFKKSLPYKLRSTKPATGVIPIGINISIAESSAEEIEEMRNRLLNWNGAEASMLLGSFGFIYAAKQPDKMIDTLRVLLEQGIKTRLVVAGDFMEDHVAEKNRFFKRIKALGLEDYVLFLGFVRDEAELSRLLSACNAVLLLFSDGVSARRSSFWTVLELGVPVITTAPSFEGEFCNLLDLQLLHGEVEFVSAGEAPERLSDVARQFDQFRLPQQRRGISPNWRSIANEHMGFYRGVLAA